MYAVIVHVLCDRLVTFDYIGFFLCLFVRPTQAEDTVVIIPYKSRHVRLVLKGPDHLCKSW